MHEVLKLPCDTQLIYFSSNKKEETGSICYRAGRDDEWPSHSVTEFVVDVGYSKGNTTESENWVEKKPINSRP